jgi:hypothetical protein
VAGRCCAKATNKLGSEFAEGLLLLSDVIESSLVDAGSDAIGRGSLFDGVSGREVLRQGNEQARL